MCFHFTATPHCVLSSNQTNELFLSLVHSYRFRPSFLSFTLRSHHHLHIVSSLTSVSIDLARSSSAPHHTTFFSLHTFAYSHSTTFHHTHSAPPSSALKRYHLPTQAFLPKSTFAVNKITKQKLCGFTFCNCKCSFDTFVQRLIQPTAKLPKLSNFLSTFR